MTNGEARSVGVCIHGGLRRQCETCDLADRLDRITAVWERFKHLDHLLSDPTWLPATPQGDVLRVCWAAILEAQS